MRHDLTAADELGWQAKVDIDPSIGQAMPVQATSSVGKENDLQHWHLSTDCQENPAYHGMTFW